MTSGEVHCRHNNMDMKGCLSMHIAVQCRVDHPELAEIGWNSTGLDLAQMWTAT